MLSLFLKGEMYVRMLDVYETKVRMIMYTSIKHVLYYEYNKETNMGTKGLAPLV